MTELPKKMDLYTGPESSCSYLPDQKSTSVFAEPGLPKTKAIQTWLSEQGFRRSGEFIYRPYCQNCSACLATRIPIKNFKLSRNQKRTWKKNQDLTVEIKPAEFDQAHFDLYKRYISSRHAGGGMDNPTTDSYMQFLSSEWSETSFIEFRLDQKLAAIAVVDQLDNALSAVYTFFDPDLNQRSLGRYAILYEIDYAQRNNLEWIYLGYWIKACQKMSYKQDYQPQEHFINGQWSMSDTP
ncbi:MAG: arginyltransferase [Gammaproteobacteria bacterium]